MLTNEENGIDCKLGTTKSQCSAYALKQWDTVFVGELTTNIVLMNLVDIDRGNLSAWWDETVIGGKST